jgi:hypothetical protein
MTGNALIEHKISAFAPESRHCQRPQSLAEIARRTVVQASNQEQPSVSRPQRPTAS